MEAAPRMAIAEAAALILACMFSASALTLANSALARFTALIVIEMSWKLVLWPPK